MVYSSLTVLLINWLVYIGLRSANRYLGYMYLFILFIFASVLSTNFSFFYLIIFLVAILLSETSPIKTENQQGSFMLQKGRFTISGFSFIILSLVVGLVIYLIIALISARVQGNIIGVPNLAITVGGLAQAFKPTFESMLGIIENFIAFVIFDLLLMYGVLIPLIGLIFQIPVFMPLVISSIVMAIFHVTAYGVAVNLLIFAAFAFALFILARFVLQDSLSSDIAHGTHNAIVSLSRSLSIVT